MKTLRRESRFESDSVEGGSSAPIKVSLGEAATTRLGGGVHALPALLTIGELSELLKLSEKTIRRMITARRLPCVRLGRQLRFVPGDVFRWLEARKEG